MALRTTPRKFSRTDRELATIFRALAHPARLQILRILAVRGACVCGEIVEVLPLSQSTVSQHLKDLKEMGLVKGQIEGARSCYCIDPLAVERARAMGNAFFDSLATEGNYDCC